MFHWGAILRPFFCISSSPHIAPGYNEKSFLLALPGVCLADTPATGGDPYPAFRYIDRDFFPSWSAPRFANRVIASTWGRLLAWLTPISVAVECGQNAQQGRSYVVVCNHQSSVDILVVYGWLKLDLKWVIKQELRKIPGIGIGC